MASSKRIEDLHPDLQPLCREFLAQCRNAGLNVDLIFTYRTPADQDKIYQQGRKLPGRIVTNLDGSKSKHCFTIGGAPAAKAFDFGIFQNGKYIQDGGNIGYHEAGQIGEGLGLTWGGRWKRPFDPGHLEIV